MGGSEPASRRRPDSRPTLVVAIDGPSGSGKSTVSRAVARRLGLRYLDTGAMYRAVTWLALHENVAPDDQERLAALARSADVRLGTDPDMPTCHVGETDVADAIRGEDVTAAVSAVSAVPGVRAALVARQRELVGAGGIVVEGRDIGTVVLPDADVKVFLTASSHARAQRRARETNGAVLTSDAIDRTHHAMARRDRLDSGRKVSPLTRAHDAVEIDSTALDIDDVVEHILALVPDEVAR